MHRIAYAHGGKCLSTHYTNTTTKLLWECAEGHQWETTPKQVRRGRWCPVCARQRAARKQRASLEDMRAVATQRGGQCLSTEYVNTKTPLSWQCANGHRWKATPKAVLRGDWCPICAKHTRRDGQTLTLDDMHAIARKRGGTCLSEHYVNNQTPLRWQCKYGHIWEATPSNVKRGTWCPVCARNRPVSTRPGRLEDMQTLARQRGGQCLSLVYINNKTKLRWQCAKDHIWDATPQQITSGSWCPICGGTAKLTIEDMHKLAQARGGKCLSSEYVNNKTKLLWECANGHQWKARPDSIKRGRWCPVCAKQLLADQFKKNSTVLTVLFSRSLFLILLDKCFHTARRLRPGQAVCCHRY